jgi:RNA polymerase sigma-70 factor (ECF subfamily)
VSETDAELIQKFCDGQTEAFNLLVERWQPRIHRVAYRYFNSHDEAMEITQKTFIKVYKKLYTLDDYAAFPAWIYRIANNLCRDETKRAGRRHPTSLAGLNNHLVAESIADKQIHQKQLAIMLQQALQQLSPEQRMVVIMKEYEALKFTEIAAALGVPESTVKSRMYAGLTKLHGIFDQWNINKETLYYE